MPAGGTRTQKLMRMDQPPPIAPLPKPDYPQIPDAVLENGLRVLAVEDFALPKVSLCLAWPTGRTSDSSGNLALTSLAIELLEEGTETRAARQIADLLDQLAIHYGTQVRMEQSQITLTVLARYLEPALDLLADLVLHPAFPEEELEKARKRWRSHLLSQRSQPAFLTRERSHAALYLSHPYSRVSFPVTHVEAADRGALRRAHRRLMAPKGALLAFSGAVKPDRATRLAERYLGRWRGDAPQPDRAPLPPVPESRRVLLVHRPHSVQARIMVAGRGLPRGHRDSTPLFLANQVLGGSASSRLFLNLREDKGYTYGAYSTMKWYRRDGVILAGADVRSDVAAESVVESLNEMERLRREPPGNRELNRCRAELAGRFIRVLETSDSVADLEVSRRLDGLPEEHYRNYVQRLQRVTPETIQETARTYMDPGRTVITVVADRSQVEKDLAQLGPVSVYDTDGNRLE